MKKNKNNTMLMKIKDKYHSLTLSEIILLCCFVVGFIFTCNFIFTGANIIFNSDTATANLLAKEQMEVDQFFPRNWTYAQDIWTFFLNIPMIFLSGFMKNQLMLRSTAVLIQTVFFATILMFFSRKILKNNSWILYCAILFTGMSEYYLENMFGQAAYGYNSIWILLLLMFGLLSIDENIKIKKKSLFIFAILIFISSIGGVRFIGSFLVPFILSVCLVYYLDNQNLLKEDTIKHFLNFIKWVVIVLVASTAGLMVFLYLTNICGYNAGLANPEIYSGYEYENIINSAKMLLPSFWILMGFDMSVPLFSIQGIFSIVKMAATIAFIFIFPLLLTFKYKTLSVSVKRLICFSWFSFIITTILFVFTPIMVNILSCRYFQFTVVLQLIISCYYIYNYMLKKNFLTTLISMIAILLFICGSLFGLVKASQNEEEALQPTYDLIEVLRQKGLAFGYASYWDAYRLSVFADFNPEIVATVGNPICPMYHLCSSRWYTEEYYKGKTFLMLDEENYNYFTSDGKLEKQFGKEMEFFQYNNYYFFVYDYNISSRFANKVMLAGEKRKLIENMCYNEFVEVNNDTSLNAKKNGIIYGPYISLQNGNYVLNIDVNFVDNGKNPLLKVTSNGGTEIIKEVELKNGVQNINLSFEKDIDGIEFTISNDSWESILLKQIFIEKQTN